MWPLGAGPPSEDPGKARANSQRFFPQRRKGAKKDDYLYLFFLCAFAGKPYRFSTMKSVIICLMCFSSSGSVTPCLDFGYSIN
jgi:hypothetical protein